MSDKQNINFPFDICSPVIGSILTKVSHPYQTECPHLNNLDECKKYTYTDGNYLGICRNAGDKCDKKDKGMGVPGTGLRKPCYNESIDEILAWAFDENKMYIMEKYKNKKAKSFVLFIDNLNKVFKKIEVNDFPVPEPEQLNTGMGLKEYADYYIYSSVSSYDIDNLLKVAFRNYCIHLRKMLLQGDTYTKESSNFIFETPKFIDSILNNPKHFGGFKISKKKKKKNNKSKKGGVNQQPVNKHDPNRRIRERKKKNRI